MGIIENVKETVGLIQKIDNLDLYRRILNLQAEVMQLVEENTELKRSLNLQQDLVFEKNAYWKRSQDSQKEGPFCPQCWDSSRLLMRSLDKGDRIYICPKCNTATC